jgi:hypothetical protein
MQQRRDTSSNWTSVNPTLASGEIGVETNTLRFKVGDGSRSWASLPYAGTTAYTLSATTTNTTPTRLTGEVWSIRGGIRRGFSGLMQMVGSLDTLTTGTLSGASVSVTPDYPGHALAITVTGPATASVDWQATVLTSEKISTQQALVGGCTDPDVGNYNAAADFDNGSCSFSAVPSSPNLKPIAYEGEIESLDVTVGSSSLYPAFDPEVKDYYVQTSSNYSGSASYSVTINGESPITGSTRAGKTLQINDGTNYYYVRLLPSDVTPSTPSGAPGVGYAPGYYLTAYSPGSVESSSYYYVFDSRGVPVWYGRTAGSAVSLHPGSEANRVFQNVPSGSRRVLRINSSSVSRSLKSMLPSPDYGTPQWGTHESLEVALPLSRKGNIVSQSYSNGFYIQEQSPGGDLVWEWHSQDYFTSVDVEYYHINSVDVHPTTGNVLVSLRNCSAVLCIDYQTKNVLWVLQGPPSGDYGTLEAVAISSQTQDTKWLTLSGEPEVDGFQYVGPRAQHDARWRVNITPTVAGNEVISLFDNQSESNFGFTSTGAGPSARGVVYEIDYANGVAIHRSSVFSENGTSPFMGSYSIVYDGGVWSHTMNLPTQHPSMVEWVGAIDGQKTKILEVDYSGNLYRIIKVPPTFLRADNLRATCGINVDTGAFLAADSGGGGGGGGGNTSLLLHFDGTNGSTTFTDSGPNALAVTATGTAQISNAQSKFGGTSAYLDKGFSGGLTSAALVGDSASFGFGTGDFTLDGWFYATSLGGATMFSVGTFGNGLLIRRQGGTNDDIYVAGTSYNYPDGLGLNLNQWTHIAVTRESGVLKVFLNGVQRLSVTAGDDLGASQPFVVGAALHSIDEEPWGAMDAFEGYVDAIRVVKGLAIWSEDFTPPSSPYTA